jgi:apolipoprotein N-acyltransferase
MSSFSTPQPSIAKASNHRWPNYLWLALAGLLLLFANGHWIVPPFAWLAPLALLRFTRHTSRLVPTLLLCWLVLLVTRAVNWYGLMPFPLAAFLASCALNATLRTIPYWLDRIVQRRIPGFLSTLMFPLSCVTIEYLTTLAFQSSWGSVAYTQTDNLPLLQLASVTGIWGIVFLVYWFGSVVDWCWEHRTQWREARVGAVIYCSAFAAVILFGDVRLLLSPPRSKTVRVASVTPTDIINAFTPDEITAFQLYVRRKEISSSQRAAISSKLIAVDDDLFQRTRREAQAGSRIIFWPEGSLIALTESEQAGLIERGKTLAREEGIYLGMTIGLVPEELSRRNENKAILIASNGEIVQQYFKTHLVPVLEEPFFVQGDGKIRPVPSPYGRLATVICYDMDDPRLLRRAGQAKVDLMFAPTGDWQEIKSIHARVARVRAVEEGFSLLRPANHGLSLAVDYQGRTLAAMDHFLTSERVMVANLPTASARTVYARIGDLLAWACLLASIALLTFAFLPRRLRAQSDGERLASVEGALAELHSASALLERKSVRGLLWKVAELELQ